MMPDQFNASTTQIQLFFGHFFSLQGKQLNRQQKAVKVHAKQRQKLFCRHVHKWSLIVSSLMSVQTAQAHCSCHA